MTSDDLPQDAETFLTRLGELPESAWDEILAHSRVRPRRLLWVLWRALPGLITRLLWRRRATGHHSVWSRAAIARMFELWKSGALPQRVGHRGLAMVHMAVQAVCLRATLTPQQVDRVYAPFAKFIPLSSLTLPQPPAPGGG